MNEKAVELLIRARAIARRERDRQQLKLLDENDQFKSTIQTKLEGLNETNQFRNFCRCGEEEIFRTCRGCSAVERYSYRCNLKWCPRCQWRVVDERKNLLRLWATKITQPKHLVLTQKNFAILTRGKLRVHRQRLASLRRRKLFRRVRGGCVSVEITNEERGWHLHSHWLLDVRWLDMERMSKVWGEMCGQEFAIVKIMDVRNQDYVKEVSKYVCEGSEMAKWPAEEINEFVTAVRGTRFFTAFGSLRALAPSIRMELNASKPQAKPCDCGCSDFIFEDETQATINELRTLTRIKSKSLPSKIREPVARGTDSSMAFGTPELDLPGQRCF
jgi:hypothetical protein